MYLIIPFEPKKGNWSSILVLSLDETSSKLKTVGRVVTPVLLSYL